MIIPRIEINKSTLLKPKNKLIVLAIIIPNRPIIKYVDQEAIFLFVTFA